MAEEREVAVCMLFFGVMEDEDRGAGGEKGQTERGIFLLFKDKDSLHKVGYFGGWCRASDAYHNNVIAGAY